MTEQLQLDFSIYAVHCMFCSATVSHSDPGHAHDDMERHYTDRHRQQIDHIIRTIR